MTVRTMLEKSGFDTIRLGFTLRTAIAACCAILLAWLAGLEHPQWSGMTVWAASLPVRSHLLERSFFRATGTIIGAIFGMALLVVAGRQPWIMLIGLSLWIGLCVGAGNILRGFTAYGAMLAGYSAAMVTLLHSAHANNPFAVGVDRMLTVLLGVAMALVSGWLFAASGDAVSASVRMQQLTRRILNAFADHLTGTTASQGAAHQAFLSEMAAIEGELDGHTAGSYRSRRWGKAIRNALSAEVSLVLQMRRPAVAGADAGLVAALREAAIHAGEGDLAAARKALQRAIGRAPAPGLQQDLAALASAFAAGAALSKADRAQEPADVADDAEGAYVVPLHRDGIGAREALVRATLVVFGIGAMWLVTGWEAGPFMLLGAAIMTAVFSTSDAPVMMVRQVIIGQALGVIGALVCRWLLWPAASSELGLVLLMMPFVIFGGFLFAHRWASGPIGFDYNMVVLLLLQPAWPLVGSFQHSAVLGGAVVLGPVLGMAAFMLIYPVSDMSRQRTLVAMMVRDIEAMSGRRGAARHRTVWRARLNHRILLLVRRVAKSGGNRDAAIEGSFALLLAGSAVLHMDALLQSPELTPGTRRRLVASLARMRRLGRDPRRAARSLRAVARRADARRGDVVAQRPFQGKGEAVAVPVLCSARPASKLRADNALDGALLLEAAAALERNADFIQAGSI